MKQKILIIDDDIDLCKLLGNNLEQEGYYACTCHSCNQFVKRSIIRFTDSGILPMDCCLSPVDWQTGTIRMPDFD